MKFSFEKIQLILTSKIDFESTILAFFDKPEFFDGYFLKNFPLSMLILGQKSCFLEPIIFKIPQPN